MRKLSSSLVLFIALALSGAALADDAAAEISAGPTEAQTGKSFEKTGRVPAATSATDIPAAVAKAQGGKCAGETGRAPATTSVEATPVRLPTYVENWDRLPELTKSDRVVSSRADFWVSRRQFVFWDMGVFSALGGGVAALATFERLDSDHWTKATKWGLAGGLSVAIVSLVIAWAISPDRNDLLNVINQWNLRHPDQPLAP